MPQIGEAGEPGDAALLLGLRRVDQSAEDDRLAAADDDLGLQLLALEDRQLAHEAEVLGRALLARPVGVNPGGAVLDVADLGDEDQIDGGEVGADAGGDLQLVAELLDRGVALGHRLRDVGGVLARAVGDHLFELVVLVVAEILADADEGRLVVDRGQPRHGEGPSLSRRFEGVDHGAQADVVEHAKVAAAEAGGTDRRGNDVVAGKGDVGRRIGAAVVEGEGVVKPVPQRAAEEPVDTKVVEVLDRGRDEAGLDQHLERADVHGVDDGVGGGEVLLGVLDQQDVGARVEEEIRTVGLRHEAGDRLDHVRLALGLVGVLPQGGAAGHFAAGEPLAQAVDAGLEGKRAVGRLARRRPDEALADAEGDLQVAADELEQLAQRRVLGVDGQGLVGDGAVGDDVDVGRGAELGDDLGETDVLQMHGDLGVEDPLHPGAGRGVDRGVADHVARCAIGLGEEAVAPGVEGHRLARGEVARGDRVAAHLVEPVEQAALQVCEPRRQRILAGDLDAGHDRFGVASPLEEVIGPADRPRLRFGRRRDIRVGGHAAADQQNGEREGE